MIFHQLVGVWGLMQMEQAVGCVSPSLSRALTHEQMQSLPSWVLCYHADCMLWWRATFHFSRKFLQKQGSISGRLLVWGRNQILFPKCF